jgi:hypothetical protein
VETTDKPESLAEKELKEVEWRYGFFNQIINELRTSDRFVQFFNHYSDTSVRNFIEHYATAKVFWYQYAERNLKAIQDDKERWGKSARCCLNLILQKKLFDLQCQWRGNKISVPGINVSTQFTWWGAHIFECPFLEPVTKAEIALFKTYLLNTEPSIRFTEETNWQDWQGIKHDFLNNSERKPNRYYGTWYDFHNRETGNDIYLALEDERGCIEQRYLDLCPASGSSDKQESQERKEGRPRIEFKDRKLFEYFLKNFDSKDSQKKYANKETFLHPYNRKKTALIEEDLWFLEKVEEKVPIESNDDWRDAVFMAAERYRRIKTLKTLPLVAKEYWAAVRAGTPFDSSSGQMIAPDNVSELRRNNIVLGRIAAGEAGDMNF